MTTQEQRHYLVEHIWRFLRASIIMAAMILWISQDGWSGTDWMVVGLGVLAHLCEQFHGLICNRIEKLLHWTQSFDRWN